MGLSPETQKLVDDYKERMKTHPRRHWKTNPDTGTWYNVFCKFYLNNRYLGAAYIPEGSFGKHRREAARRLGIHYYNGLVLGNRDLRFTRVKCRNGKIRKDIDFIHPSDFPKSNLGMVSGIDKPMTRRQFKKLTKMNRETFEKKFPNDIEHHRVDPRTPTEREYDKDF